MMLKVNSTDDFQISMDLSVNYNIPKITIKVSFWDKKNHFTQDFEYNASDFDKAIKKFNELEMDTKNKNDSHNTMKFVDFIKEYLIKNEDEYDAIIGDVEMPATLGVCPNWKITNYCMEKFGDLLNSDCKIIPAQNDSDTPVVEVFYDNFNKGILFCKSLAGYVNAKEFDKLFGTHDAEN